MDSEAVQLLMQQQRHQHQGGKPDVPSRYKLLVPKIIDSLKSITGKDFKNYKNWSNWWDLNRKKFEVKD